LIFHEKSFIRKSRNLWNFHAKRHISFLCKLTVLEKNWIIYKKSLIRKG
jgi:hypothetical protein